MGISAEARHTEFKLEGDVDPRTGVNIRQFIRDGIEALLNDVTPGGVDYPYHRAAEVVAKKHKIVSDEFKWAHHPFHWFLVLEKGIIVMEHNTPSSDISYMYKKVSDSNLDDLTEEMFNRYGTLISERIKAFREGKYND